MQCVLNCGVVRLLYRFVTSISVASADVGISATTLFILCVTVWALEITSCVEWPIVVYVVSIQACLAAICSCEVVGIGRVIFILGIGQEFTMLDIPLSLGSGDGRMGMSGSKFMRLLLMPPCPANFLVLQLIC